ncbi:MAG TPA: 50S ribosomal protein L25 [Clostridiaceae bacterium]|nr:50S ribosomal protein L25 [Clostridiaceae bacterium]
MSDTRIKLEKRDLVGGGKAKRLRRNGYIPAVIYGQDMTASPAQIKLPDIKQFLAHHGKNSIFTVEFAAENDFSALIKDIQYDPVKKDIVHVDFQKVSLTEKIHYEVPVKVIGKGNVEKDGNVIVYQLDSVAVECLPQDIPSYIEADISNMTAGHSVTAGQLKLPPGVKLITDPNSVILSITGGGKLDVQVNKVDEPVVPVGEEGNVQAERV